MKRTRLEHEHDLEFWLYDPKDPVALGHGTPRYGKESKSSSYNFVY